MSILSVIDYSGSFGTL